MTEERPAETAVAAPQSSPRRRRRSRLFDIAAVGVLILVLVYLHTRVVRVVYVSTGSMKPTIQPGDRLLMSVGAYRKARPQHGDIIAFWAEGQGEFEVKRVIGVAGDELFVGAGVVVRNGHRLRESYLAEPMLPEIPVGRRLREGELWVMGDNRNGSEDSRDYGPIPEKNVKGRIFYRILPLNRAGRVK